MKSKPALFYRALVSGSAASLLSTVVLVERSRRENKAPFAAVNAVSHWLHDDAAYAIDEPSWRHTLAGIVIHHASSLFWALGFEAVIARIAGSRDTAAAAAPEAASLAADLAVAAAVITAVAALTDLRLVPPRLSPGFEHRLSRSSVTLVYLAFGLGLALSGAVHTRAHAGAG